MVAGTDDGHIVLMFGADASEISVVEEWSNRSNAAYVAARGVLGSAGIQIERARPVISRGILFGYVIYADGDAYAVLQELAESEDAGDD